MKRIWDHCVVIGGSASMALTMWYLLLPSSALLLMGCDRNDKLPVSGDTKQAVDQLRDDFLRDQKKRGEEDAMEELFAARRQSQEVNIPAPTEFFKSDDPKVKAHGGRISLKNLDLTRPPTEEELRLCGQLGSPLDPVGSADPDKIDDPVLKQRQQSDNLLFGQAMQKWNEHHYDDAVELFRKHRAEFKDSPWAGEAQLHLGCQQQFSGSWEEAKYSFEWILNNLPKGSGIYQKAQLRRAVLHLDQGELDEATAAFTKMLGTEQNWERKTYASHWIQQISLYKGHETALRDCGTESIAYVLHRQGEEKKARKARGTQAPGPRGFSLGELSNFAKQAGLKKVQAVRTSLAKLDKLPMPFVAHYTDRHFVVVDGVEKDGTLRVYDPRLKRETQLNRKQFSEQWSGLAVVSGKFRKDSGRPASKFELSETYGGCCGLPRNESGMGPPPEQDPPPPCPEGPTCSPQGYGLPVYHINPVNMNIVMWDVPMWFSEPIGPDVEMRITYNSQDSLNQFRPFGNKWIFDYTSYALESPAQGGPGMVLIVMPGGRRDNYQPNGSGGYNSPAGIQNQLRKTGPYAFELEKPDGTIFRYGVPVGMNGTTSLLLSITDRHNVALSMTYDANGSITKITDAQNREWSFLYNAQGLVSRIDDPFGRQATFSYDVDNRLIGQTDMGGLTYGYTYDTNQNLASLIKPGGTTQFYVEPSDGSGDPPYAPPGSFMGWNYRITVTDAMGQREEFYYNANSVSGWHRDKLQMKSPLGVYEGAPMTRYSYQVVSGQGVVSRVTYANGTYKESSNFTTNRQPQTLRDEAGNQTLLTYNAQGRPLTVKDARNNTTTYEYAANGIDVVKVTNALNQVVSEITYDAHRNVTSVKDALNRTTTFTYNSYDQPETVTDNAGRVGTMLYDAQHQLTSVKLGTQTLQSLTYDAFGRVETSTNADGYTLGYQYDGLDRVTRVTFPDGTYTQTQWGCCVVERQRDRAGQWTTNVHDALNRLVFQRDAKGQFVSFQYDENDNLLKLIDGEGKATQWSYDNMSRVSRKIYADGTINLFAYDALNRLKEKTDAKGVKSTFAYDATHNLTQVAVPGMPTVTYAYDALNRRSQMVDGVGTTTYAYNAASQVTSVDGPWANDTITYGYDNLGRRTSRAIDGVAETVAIDAMGRMESATNALGTFQYAYTAPSSGKLASATAPNGQVTTYGYHSSANDQRLAQIWHKNATAATISKFDYAYNPLGQITQWTQQAGAATPQRYEFGYDAIGQLTSALLKDTSSGSIVKNYFYAYDRAGNRVSEAIDGAVAKDTPNAVNALIQREGGKGVMPIRGQLSESSQVKINGVVAKVFPDNSFEGRAEVEAGNNAVTVEAIDANGNVTTNHYQVVASGSGVKTLTYDLNGNLLSGGSRTFEWDALNQLTAINYVGTAKRSEFSYNGSGQRIRIVEKDGATVLSDQRYLWCPDDSQPSQERDASNNVTKRYLGQGVQIGSANYFYTCDHLGSVRELCDASGVVRARFTFDPWGRRTKVEGDLDADMAFTGHFHHAPSQLSLTLYRAYDPQLGRWLSKDPIEEYGGLNLYAYVGGDPLNAVDLFGLCAGEQPPPAPNPYTTAPQALWVLGMVLGKAAVPAAKAAAKCAGKTAKTTSRQARREAMRQEGIPTSQQPSSQSRNASGREQSYEVSKPGGGTQTKSVQQQTMDSSHPGQGHWEAGKVKTDPLTGETRMNQYDRPKLTNDKSKVNYDE